jgi:hypothetical protein
VLKLYKVDVGETRFWETWDNDNGSHIVHWGVLGTRGDSKTVMPSLLKKAESKVQEEIDGLVAEGYRSIDLEEHYTLLIEYKVDGMGTADDVEKRHRLEERMNETLGWTGLGSCDGGSIGSGTMEVCNFVVDFELAMKVIEADLVGTEFENFTRIYDENAERS